jgi:hypothetical protein
MTCGNPNTATRQQRDHDRNGFNIIAISSAEASGLIDVFTPFISIQIDARSSDERLVDELSVIRTHEKLDGSLLARSFRCH